MSKGGVLGKDRVYPGSGILSSIAGGQEYVGIWGNRIGKKGQPYGERL